MDDDLARQWEVKGEQQSRPDETVEAQDVLAEHVDGIGKNGVDGWISLRIAKDSEIVHERI